MQREAFTRDCLQIQDLAKDQTACFIVNKNNFESILQSTSGNYYAINFFSQRFNILITLHKLEQYNGES